MFVTSKLVTKSRQVKPNTDFFLALGWWYGKNKLSCYTERQDPA